MPRVTRNPLTLAPAPMGPRIRVEPINDPIVRKYFTPRAVERAKRELRLLSQVNKGTIFKNFKIFNAHNRAADLIVTSVIDDVVCYKVHGKADSPEWVTTRQQVLEWVNQYSPD